MTKKPKLTLKPFKVVYLKDNNGTWSWRLLTKAGSPMAIGSEPYAARWVARRAVKRVMSASTEGYDEIDEKNDYPFEISPAAARAKNWLIGN